MQKYHITSRILHWVMAVLIFGLLGVGIYMTNFLASDDAARGEIYGLHKSFGVLVLILIFARILNRVLRPALLPDISLSKFEKIASHFVHILLYILMVAIPLSGYLMSNGYGYEVHLFSIKMPMLIAKNYQIAGIAAKIHKFGGYLMIATLFLHIGAILKHRFIDKNDVLKRMI